MQESLLQHFRQLDITLKHAHQSNDLDWVYDSISTHLSYFIKLYVSDLLPKTLQPLLQEMLQGLPELLDSLKVHHPNQVSCIMLQIHRYWRVAGIRNKKSQTNFDCYLKTLHQSSHDTGQSPYLKAVNENLIDIVNNEIRLPNSDCVSCSEVFIRGQEIRNYNPQFPYLIALGEVESYDVLLEKYICALCNAGGGSIIIGAEKKGNRIWAKGISFARQLDAVEKINELSRNFDNIKPDYISSIHNIKVHCSLLEKEEDIIEEKNRYCFRINIQPKSLDRKHYLTIYNKGYNNLYEIFELDSDLTAYRIESELDAYNEADTLFEIIQSSHRNKKKVSPNSHQGIKCCMPYLLPSKLFAEYTDKNKHNVEKMTAKEKEMDQVHSDEPKFKYMHTSILVVGSKKKDRYVKELVSLMKSKKMLFESEKPFQNSFKEGSRSIWMLSHHDKHEVIKNCIKQSDNTGSITMIPLFKTLQIDKTRLPDNIQLEIEQKFHQRYHEEFKVQTMVTDDENGLIKHPVFMTFNCYTHAMYAYMIFQSMQLRPYFVKENTVYKKKPKKQLD